MSSCLTTQPTNKNQPNPFTIQNTSLYRWPEGLAITTLWACPNSNQKTLTSDSQHICTWGGHFSSHHCSLQSSMLPDTDHGYYALLRLQCFSLVAPSYFMRVDEPSCLLPLPSMPWLSSLFSVAQVPLPSLTFLS